MEIVMRMKNRYKHLPSYQYESVKMININDIDQSNYSRYVKMQLNRINDSLYNIFKEINEKAK